MESLEGGPRKGRPRARDQIARGGRLADLDPRLLAESFGTPLYVYDFGLIERNVSALFAALPSFLKPIVPVRANPALAILSHLSDLGVATEVGSEGELNAAIQAGVAPSDVIFASPGKRDHELHTAVAACVRAVTVESLAELVRLERIASSVGTTVQVLLRLGAYDAPAASSNLLESDGVVKFGMDEDDVLSGIARAMASQWLTPIGIHASGSFSSTAADALASRIQLTVKRAVNIFRRGGSPLKMIHADVGISAPYELEDQPLDVANLAARLRTVHEELHDDMSGAEVMIDASRFVLGPAGAYLTRVLDVKSRTGCRVVITDGGVHHVLGPILAGQDHRFQLFEQGGSKRGAPVPVIIAGPLSTGIDVFTHRVVLKPPEADDLLALLDVGAYGYSQSMPLFLSHPLPAEVAIIGGEAIQIRPRIDPEYWLDNQVVPTRRTTMPQPLIGGAPVAALLGRG